MPINARSLFRTVIKYCECGTELKLNNNRDIKRKKFCSRRCRMKHSHKTGIIDYPERSEHMQRDIALGIRSLPPRPSNEIMKKVGLRKRGSNHVNWIVDRSKLKKKRYNCSERNMLESIRKDIFERDNYTCQVTFIRGGKLEVHHIKNWSDHPKDRHDKNNMITLSKTIHKLFHNKYGRKNNTLIQFQEFRKELSHAA